LRLSDKLIEGTGKTTNIEFPADEKKMRQFIDGLPVGFVSLQQALEKCLKMFPTVAPGNLAVLLIVVCDDAEQTAFVVNEYMRATIPFAADNKPVDVVRKIWAIRIGSVPYQQDVEQGKICYLRDIQTHCACCRRKETSEAPLRACPNCKTAVYCDRKCQLHHWPAHKLYCDAELYVAEQLVLQPGPRKPRQAKTQGLGP
jgi:hypothetical protein